MTNGAECGGRISTATAGAVLQTVQCSEYPIPARAFRVGYPTYPKNLMGYPKGTRGSNYFFGLKFNLRFIQLHSDWFSVPNQLHCD